MKHLTLIFCLFIFSLSSVPCCAEENEVPGRELHAGKSHDLSHDEDDCCNLPCSPFFSCSSCLHFAEPSNSNLLDLPCAGALLTHVATYDRSFISPAGNLVWQPPKQAIYSIFL